MLLNIGLFGAGRIGKVHAQTITRNPDARLVAVCDKFPKAAEELARQYDCAVSDQEDLLQSTEINAILVASSTDTHADLIEAGLAAGKAVFCEKPLDLDLARAREVQKTVDAASTPVMMAFNRRFDPNFMALKTELDAGLIGNAELITITSFDPGPPPIDYIKVSGGLFRDMTIHDFDLACWLMGSAPLEVTATGSNLVSAEIGEAGDIDTASITLRFEGGRIATILNSRRAAYGYDQRIEVLGSKGLLSAQNVLENTLKRSTSEGVTGAKPEHFFLERYAQAYSNELDQFIASVRDGATVSPNVADGVTALAIADAALQSSKENRTIRL